MTVSLKHAFASPKADGADATKVRPSNWNAEHVLNMSGSYILGRQTAGEGPVEEITAIRVSPTGNVGIGTDLPADRLHVVGGNIRVDGLSSSPVTGIIMQNAGASAVNNRIVYVNAHNEGNIAVAGLEIDVSTDGSSSLIGAITRPGSRASDRRYRASTLSSIGSLGTRFEVRGAGGAGAPGGVALNAQIGGNGESFVEVNHNATSVNNNWYAGFLFNGTPIGAIVQNGTTGVTYGTNSDHRLKNVLSPLSGALAKLALLKPKRVEFKSEPGRQMDSFLAHEVQEVVPEAVTGTKDEVNGDGAPIYQGVDLARLVPLLTAAIQEQIALIQEQQAMIAALTARVTALEAAQ